MTGVLESNMRSVFHQLSLDLLGNLTRYLLNQGDMGGTEETPMTSNLTTEFGEDRCYRFRFIFYTLVIGIICILGIAGNTLSLVILQRDRSNSVALYLLQALAIADNCLLLIAVLILGIIYGLLPQIADSRTTNNAIAYGLKYGEPFAFMSHVATIWMTVLIALNRYIAVCKPFQAGHICTMRKTRIQVFIVFAFSVIFNLPRFFQWKLVTSVDPRTNETLVVPFPTSIGYRSTFAFIYTNILYSIIVVVLPLIMLIMLNSRLIKEINRMKARRSTLTLGMTPVEENVTTIMVVIIIVVVICNIPDRVVHIIRAFAEDKSFRHCGRAPYYFFAAANLLVILNSSVNFLIYYIMRKSFRKILKIRLCRMFSSEETVSTPAKTNGEINSFGEMRALMKIPKTGNSVWL